MMQQLPAVAVSRIFTELASREYSDSTLASSAKGHGLEWNHYCWHHERDKITQTQLVTATYFKN
jgi:hypothetical protein